MPSVFDSIKEQSYADIEWIIVDGGSTDGTVDFIKQNEESIGQWISEPDAGIYNALNKGIALATGHIIGFVHSDDFLSGPKVIEGIHQQFEQSGSDGVYGDLNYIAAKNTSKIIRKWRSKSFRQRNLNYGWMPAHPTLFLRKSVYEKHGLFDESFRIAADYDFMLRVLQDNSLQFRYHPKVITHMRLGGASSASSNLKKKMGEDLRAMRKNNLPYPWLTLVFKNFRKLGQFL